MSVKSIRLNFAFALIYVRKYMQCPNRKSPKKYGNDARLACDRVKKGQGYGVDFIYSQQLPKKSIGPNSLLYKKLYV